MSVYYQRAQVAMPGDCLPIMTVTQVKVQVMTAIADNEAIETEVHRQYKWFEFRCGERTESRDKVKGCVQSKGL